MGPEARRVEEQYKPYEDAQHNNMTVKAYQISTSVKTAELYELERAIRDVTIVSSRATREQDASIEK